MAEFFDVVFTRRSIRVFEEKPVPAEVLEQVFEAARWAPSWANTQCWEIVSVTDTAVKEELQRAVPNGNPSWRTIANAPVVLVICGKKHRAGYYKGAATTKFDDWMLFDLGIVSQNISLAAHALGLGSVILGLFDQEAARGAIQLPEEYELVALIPMGYPTKEAAAPPRREVSAFVHENVFH